MVVLLDVEDSELNPKNTLKIRRWNGGNKDKVLHEISQFLASIPINKLNAETEVGNCKHQQEVRKRIKDKVSNYGIRLD